MEAFPEWPSNKKSKAQWEYKGNLDSPWVRESLERTWPALSILFWRIPHGQRPGSF